MAPTEGRCRCGSALPDEIGLVTCPSCGRVTRVDDDLLGHEPPADTGFDGGPPVDDRVGWVGQSLETATAARRAKGCGLIVVTVVFLLALGIAVVGFNRVRRGGDGASRQASSRIVLAGSVVPLGGGSSDVLAVVQDYTGASHRYLARLDVGGARIAQRWTSPELPGGTDRAQAVRSGSSIVIAFEQQVWVLDADSGALRWRAATSDQVSTSCKSCLSVIGGQIVVRTVDAYLTGYRLDGPTPLWRRRLASTSAGVTVLGPNLVTVDEDPQTPGATVQAIDPSTGTNGISFRPVCPNPDTSRAPIPLSLGDSVQAVPGTGDAISVSAYGDGCVVRWEVATGTLRWATRIDGITSVDARTPILTAADLVAASGDGRLLHVDLATGVARTLDAGTGVRASPALLRGRQLLAWTTTTEGAPQGGLEGFDLVDGSQQWAARLPGDATPATSASVDGLGSGVARAVLVPRPGRVDVAIFAGTDRRLDLGRLDPDTGAIDLAPPRQYRTRYDRNSVALTVEAAGSGTLLVTLGDLLERIDPSTGAITTYP